MAARLRKERPSSWSGARSIPTAASISPKGTDNFLRERASDGAHGTSLVQNVTEQRRWEGAYKCLIEELNHRAKDILSIIPSTCRQAQWTTDSVETFAYVSDKRFGATGAGPN